MKTRLMCMTLMVCGIAGSGAAATQTDPALQPYLTALQEKGKAPIEFVLDKLDRYDLILFDDALHTAVEPFDFYGELVRTPEFRKKIDYVFLEAVSVNQQTALDAYYQSESGDVSLLYPAFQNDFSGTGWPYQTYFDLLRAIWEANASLPEDERIQVVAVNAPVFWKEIETPRDVELFRLSLAGNDYTMYKIMLSYLDDFGASKKGVFLTNTRHAYKHIKRSNGQAYWNCGTFFSQFHPGKTCSIRFHNVNLYFEEKKKLDPNTPRTTQGLERYNVSWIRMEDGLWDSAFAANGNRPVAIDLAGTPFGEAAYVGNHMLNVAPGQTMANAYDALVFLVPIEQTHQTAMVDFIYTDEFKRELERRAPLLYDEEQLQGMMAQAGAKTVRDLIDRYFVYEPEAPNPLAKNVGPVDAWKSARQRKG